MLTGNLHGDMAEPAILFRAVPVLDIGGNHHDAALIQTDSGLAFFLIPAFTSRADQELTAAFVCMMNMPVFAAPRLEGHIGGKQTAFRVCQRIQKRIANEKLSVSGICRSRAEYIDFLELFFAFILHNKNLL